MEVEQAISPSDRMLVAGLAEHYFSAGKSALNAIQKALSEIGAPEPRSILDFGCGAGRVTRWLRTAYPDAELSASDLSHDDLAFVRRHFWARTWLSATDPTKLFSPRSFDLIWAGSVLTHLDAKTSETLVRTLLNWLNPGGVLIVSLHGEMARKLGDNGYRYLPKRLLFDPWRRVTRQYQRHGYGYADYPGQRGYGVSLCSRSWMQRVADRSDASVAVYEPALWDNHQDVAALTQNAHRTSLAGARLDCAKTR